MRLESATSYSVVGEPGTQATNRRVNMRREETYTQWAVKYSWHVSDEPYPSNQEGDCTCDCEHCHARGAHKANREAHKVEPLGYGRVT